MNQEIDILINNKPIRKFAHNGKIFVEAREGQEYSIRLKNNSTHRVLGVPSVDGVNPIDGALAAPKGAGYIITGYSSYTIRGFRTSDNEVHPFIFSKKTKSYAANSEITDFDDRDCGVIGAIFHAEKIKPKPPVRIKEVIVEREIPVYRDRYPWNWPYGQPYWYTTSSGLTGTMNSSCASNSSTSMNSNNNMTFTSSLDVSSLQAKGTDADVIRSCNFVASAEPAEFDLGTEFADEAVTDRVVTSEFQIAYQLCQFEIYYASREQLIAMGVPVDRESAVAFPSAFQSGYCKPPRRK